MDRERPLQVVLGEAEPDEGFLRFVLEGEGFDIVGMASTDADLDRVLRGARPDVIVLDAGISARAAVEAKEQGNGAALVVIWPGDVVAAIADEHVEPHLVVDDLGPAVRSASLRARPREERVVIPDTIGEVIDRWREAERVHAPAAPPEEARPEPPRLDRSARGVLVAAMTWILVLTTLATIAVGVPQALDVLADRSPGRRSPGVHPTPSPSPRTVKSPEPAGTSPEGCDSDCSANDEGRAGGNTKKQGADRRKNEGSTDAGGITNGGGSDGNSQTGDQNGSGTQDQGNQDQGNQDQGQDRGNQDQQGNDQGDGGSQQQDDQGEDASSDGPTPDPIESGSGDDIVVSIA